MTKKRTLWLAAAAFVAAVAVAAVAGCKQDDEEDDWYPLLIRNSVLERYVGERQTLTVPDGVTAIGSKAFSGSDVTAVIIPGSVTEIAPDAFDGSKVTSVSYLGTKEEWNELTDGGLPEGKGIRVACFIIDGKGILVGYGGDETDVVIPAGIVTGIAATERVFRARTDITGVTIPGSVRDIAADAFADCTELKDVRIEAGVAHIGASAFAGCTALESLVIPAGVTDIADGAFRGCAGLTDLTVHESVTTIAPGAFAGCAGLKGNAGAKGLAGIFYRAKIAKWEKLLAEPANAELEQALAGFTVHCTDGDWNGPAEGNTEIPGDPSCEHDLIMEHTADGHYEICTRCDYQSATVPHRWSEIRTDDAGEHSRTCTTERCGYTEPVDHIWSDGYKNDADNHYKTCTIAGCAARTNPVQHDYRHEITDKDSHKAICNTCGYSKDEAHTYDDEDVKCTACGYRKAKPGKPECVHEWDMKSDADGHYQECKLCGATLDSEPHQYDGAPYIDNGNGNHYRNCTVCGYKSEHAAHWSAYKDDGNGKHSRTCTATGCDYSETVPHDWNTTYEKDADKHYKTCTADCGAHYGEGTHQYEDAPYKDDGKGKHYRNCNVCGYESEHVAHTWGAYINDGNGHYQECTACEYKSASVDHDYVGAPYIDNKNDKHYQECKLCKHKSDPVDHTWGATYTNDKNGGHYQTCTATGCGAHTDSIEHTPNYTKNDGNTHNVTCKAAGCDYSVKEFHTITGYEPKDDDKHNKVCGTCEGRITVSHNYKYTGSTDNTHTKTCEDCKHSVTEEHTWNDGYTGINDTTHTRTCKVCKHSVTEEHTWRDEYTDDKDGTHHSKTCEDCKHLVAEEHTWRDGYTDSTDDTHTKTCKDCDASVSEKHQYVTGVCACGKELKLAGGKIDQNGVLTEYTEKSDKNVVIPEGVTGIGKDAFQGCWGLETVEIPESVTSIGESAFKDCSNLTSVTIAEGVKNIEGGAFAGCHGLTEVEIPGTVETIGGGAFQTCTGLQEVIIKDGVKNIEHGAFQGCSNLKKVTIPDSVTSIGVNAFQGTGITDITISKNVTSIGKDALACGNLKTITFTGTVAEWLALSKDSGVGDNVTVTCTDGIVPLDITEDKTLRHYYGRETDVQIPWNSIETIGEAAFAGSGVTTVTITEGVKHINDGAFQGCGNLTHIEIPMSVETIGYNAFAYCNKLKTITFAGTQEQWNKLVKANDIGLGDNVNVTCSGN